MQKIIIITLLITVLFFITASPQQSSLSKGVNYISEFIASGYFQSLKKNNNDLALTDSIYLRAKNYYNSDVEDALLTLTFATVPYKKVPIQFPVIKATWEFPLIAHNDSIFYKKNEQLPSSLYFNTPHNSYGDKDKLAHFFGSAYISYQSRIFDLGAVIGYFVEVFEESFKVQSTIDERDLETNELGNLLGEMLKKNKDILPSRILLIPTIKNFRYNL